MLTQKRFISYGDGILPGSYRLGTTFEAVDNFYGPGNFLLSLTGNPHLCGPYTIVTNDFVPGQIKHIDITHDTLNTGSDAFPITDIPLYDSSFICPPVSYDTVTQKVRDFLNSFGKRFPAGSLIYLLYPNKASENTSAFDVLLTHEFLEAYKLLPINPGAAAAAFKGRGKGLTPSGDDFNAGMLWAAHIYQALTGHSTQDVRALISAQATTGSPFSATVLHMAYAGRYFGSLKNFLSAFFILPLQEINEAFVRIIEHGHSSGGDILCGFMAGLLHMPQALKHQNI